MNELQITNQRVQTPIEALLQIGDDERVSSRSVFEFMMMNSANYARWCRSNIENNQFAENGVDYVRSSLMMNGNETLDYRLSIAFAKKLCMLSRSERGEQARNYFIKVEDTLKKVVHNLPALTTNEILLQVIQNTVNQEREIAQIKAFNADVEVKQNVLEARIDTTEQLLLETGSKIENTLQTFTTPSYATWKADMKRITYELCEASGLAGMKLLGCMYKELEAVANVNLETRRKRLKERMRKQGYTYRECFVVSKMDVIDRDKQLRAIFEGILKHHQAIYAVDAAEA